MKRWKTGLAAVAFAATLAPPAPAHAEGFLEDAGWGALTVVSNVFYMPAKMGYALMGGITGGLAFLCTGGDLATAETVWVSSLGGTYVVTPRMLQGQDPIAFAGSPAGTLTAESEPPLLPADDQSSLSEETLGDG
jgi:hypothetical protein